MKFTVTLTILICCLNQIVAAQRLDIALLETQCRVSRTPENVISLSAAYQETAKWFKKTPQFNRDSAAFYFEKSSVILENNKPLQYQLLAEVYNTKADFYYYFHDFNKSNENATKAFYYLNLLNNKDSNKILKYEILNIWALCLVDIGQVNKSLELYSQAYQLLSNDPRLEIRAKVLKDRGIFYTRYNEESNRETILESLNESLKIYGLLNDPQNNELICRIYRVLSSYYMYKGKTDSTIYYLEKYKNIISSIGNPYASGYYGMNYGEMLLYQLKDYAAAEKKIKGSMALLDSFKLGNSNYYQYDLYLLGTIAKIKRNYDLAVDYFKRSKAIAQAINFEETVLQNLNELSEISEKRGDYSQSLAYYKEYMERSLKIEKERYAKSLKENDLEISILSKEKEIASQRIIQWVIGIVAIILLGFSFVLFRLFKARTKTNALLEQVNQKLYSKNTENELLLKEIHHRVKNNLQVLSSLLHLQSRHIKDEAALDAVREGQNRVEAMGLIHQKLYMGENLTAVDMPDYLKNLADTILDSFGIEDNSIQIVCNIQPLFFDVDTAIPMGLIINELVTNALKYGFPKNTTNGIISLSLHVDTANKLCLKVADNGVGKADAPQLKNSTSFGTNLVQLLSKKLKGKLEVLSVEKGYATLIRFDEYKIVSLN